MTLWINSHIFYNQWIWKISFYEYNHKEENTQVMAKLILHFYVCTWEPDASFSKLMLSQYIGLNTNFPKGT